MHAVNLIEFLVSKKEGEGGKKRVSGRDVEKASGVGAKIIGAYFLTI